MIPDRPRGSPREETRREASAEFAVGVLQTGQWHEAWRWWFQNKAI